MNLLNLVPGLFLVLSRCGFIFPRCIESVDFIMEARIVLAKFTVFIAKSTVFTLHLSEGGVPPCELAVPAFHHSFQFGDLYLQFILLEVNSVILRRFLVISSLQSIVQVALRSELPLSFGYLVL